MSLYDLFKDRVNLAGTTSVQSWRMVKLATELLLAVACVQIMEVVKEDEEDLAFVQVMEMVNRIGVKTLFQSGEKRQSERLLLLHCKKITKAWIDLKNDFQSLKKCPISSSLV